MEKTEIPKQYTDKIEMANIIYDTIMKNTNHSQFQIHLSENESIDDEEGIIYFKYLGNEFKVTIEALID